MKRPNTNSKLIVAFVVMLLLAYVILALALTCKGQELNQIQIMSCGLFAVISDPKRSRGSHMTVREILEEFWREEDSEMEKIEHEAFREDIQKILRGHK
jgi:hypothetical protein